MHRHSAWRFLFLLGIAGIIAACSIGGVFDEDRTRIITDEPTEVNSLPEMIHYDMPAFPSLLEMPNTGCVDDRNGWITCPEDSEPGILGCVSITPLNDTYGGLDPALPIMSCRMDMMMEDLPEDEYLYNIGCPTNLYVRMLAYRDGKFEVIKGVPDLQKVFAPIESSTEAISYAVAATGYWAGFQMEADENLRYLAEKIEDTHAVETDAGYIVNLFGYQLCGCGPHTYYRVDVTLTRDGEIMAISDRIPLYEDPADDGKCID